MSLIKRARLKLLVVNSVTLHLTAYMYLEHDRFKYIGRKRLRTYLQILSKSLDIIKLTD